MSLAERFIAFRAGGDETTSPMVNDRELVVAFQSGETRAYADIDRKYRPTVTRICHRLLSNPHDAEEAVQETMLRALIGLERFNGQYKLDAWIVRIATNVCLDAMRKSARRPVAVELTDMDPTDREFVTPAEQDPSAVVVQRSEGERVIRLLSSLPDHHRDALVLREFEGKSHEEIGVALGLDAPRAKALLHRARRLFRETWSATLVAVFVVLRGLEAARRFIVDPVRAEASPLMNAAASSPMVSNAVTSGGDKIVASMTAIAVVGALGAGTVVVQHKYAPRHPSFAASAPAPAQSVKPLAYVVESPRVELAPPVAIKPTPSPSLSPTPSVSPSVDPSSAPSPSVSPSPTLAPEPQTFNSSFTADFATPYRCGCENSPLIDGERVDVRDGSIESFSQRVSGIGAQDKSGATAWNAAIEESSQDLRNHVITFIITTSEGQYRYGGQGTLVAKSVTDWGGWTYVFEGPYSFSSGPTHGGGDLPERGRYMATVTISPKSGRIRGVDLTIRDNR